MNSSSDAAEQMVRMYLQGVQVVAKVSGKGVKDIAAYLAAIANSNNKTKGKTTLTKMLKSGRPLKVFSLNKSNLKKFTEEARKYGVLYNIVSSKKNDSLVVDIIVREEDAAKINRIVERFNFASVETATIRNEVEKSIDKYRKEEVKKNKANPNLALTEKENLSEHYSKSTKILKSDLTKKESVRKKINNIKQELNSKNNNVKTKNKNIINKNKIKKER